MKFHDAMRKVFRQFSPVVLQDDRLVTLLSGYHAFDSRPGIRQVMESIASDGYGRELYRRRLDGGSAIRDYAGEVRQALVSDRHFSRELSDYAVDSVLYAIGLLDSVEEPSFAVHALRKTESAAHNQAESGHLPTAGERPEQQGLNVPGVTAHDSADRPAGTPDAPEQRMAAGKHFSENTVSQDHGAPDQGIQSAAESGDAAAQYRLGLMYEEGKGVRQDDASALRWYRKSAVQGNPDAQYRLGRIYEEGKGISQDNSFALRWYRKSAGQGNSDAEYSLGMMYEKGQGVGQDNEQAARCYSVSADHGNPEAKERLKERKWDLLVRASLKNDSDAQYELGRMCLDSSGAGHDEEEAARWFLKAAEQGNISAQYSLGQMYYHGTGVTQDDAEAVKWYQKAAEQGRIDALKDLGDIYRLEYKIRDYGKAREWYRKAAEQGNAEAMIMLGIMCENGEGAEESYSEAAEWYRKAAEQGDAKAQCRLGDLYFSGKGVRRDYDEAVRWYGKAVSKEGIEFLSGDEEWLYMAVVRNDPEAMSNLASSFQNGYSGKNDYAEARKWYLKAAELGDVPSMRVLGYFYLNGEGGPQDNAEGLKWFRKAADLGDSAAQGALGKVYEDGQIVSRDYAEAFIWYSKAAAGGSWTAKETLKDPIFELYFKAIRQNDADAQFRLAELYIGDDWHFRHHSLEESDRFLHMAADNGSAEAPLKLGDKCYNHSKLVEAVKWYRMAAMRGSKAAQLKLGRIFMSDRFRGIARDYAEARKWYLMAAEQAGQTRREWQEGQDDAEAAFCLGRIYAEGLGVDPDYAEAWKWFSRLTRDYDLPDQEKRLLIEFVNKLRQSTDAVAQFILGEMFRIRTPVVFLRAEEAVECYRKAAERGHAEAQFQLGCMLQSGMNYPRDYAEAARWFSEAARQGHMEAKKRLDEPPISVYYKAGLGDAAAEYSLGRMYEEGHDAVLDYHKAAEWYRKSADLGNADAMYRLGRMRDDGIGMSQNKSEALEWYRKAAALGNADARNLLGSW